MFESGDRRPASVARLKAAIGALSEESRARPGDLRSADGEPNVAQLKSVVAHFQRLFDVGSVAGVFPRMTEVYMRLGETYNATNTMRDLLGLGEALGGWRTRGSGPRLHAVPFFSLSN